jgi:hypothetical protein
MSINYRPILPSAIMKSVSSKSSSTGSYAKKMYNNPTIKEGLILAEVKPEDRLYNSGREYDVMTVEQRKTGGINSVTYKNCLALDSFGGIADYLQFTRRAVKDRANTEESGAIKGHAGSTVLLMCLDGNSEKAIIVGAIAHPDKDKILTDEKEHHLEGEFNGMAWSVNKDGELTVTFKSKTDNDGKPQDTTAGGSFAKMDKTGSITLSDGETETIKIDKPAKQIKLNAKSDINSTTTANFKVSSGALFNVQAGSDAIINAQGSAIYKSGGTFDILAGGAAGIKAPSFDMQIDGAISAQASSVQINAPSIQLGAGGPAVLLNTIFLGIGNLGAPVISTAIGPFSSTVTMGS